jgi:hypothetical protein
LRTESGKPGDGDGEKSAPTDVSGYGARDAGAAPANVGGYGGRDMRLTPTDVSGYEYGGGRDRVRRFLFERDTFTFANELYWEYRIDPVTGATTTFTNDPPPA